MSKHNFVAGGPKFIQFFLFNAAATVVYSAVYRLLIAPSFPDISALKVESCSKSRRILDFFCPPKF